MQHGADLLPVYVVHAGCYAPQAVQRQVCIVQEGINVEAAPGQGGPAWL